MKALPARLLAATLLLCLAACAGVPFDYPKTASDALPRDPETRLGAASLKWHEDHGEYTGFVSMPDGIDALGARLRLMELAETSIDAQYFILKNDRAGALFVGKMLRAADRGVRVRLLLDDVFTSGIDMQLTVLSHHPNIEIRLFNPLSRQSFKYWSYLLDFSRANRRMHNKSFTVDGAVSIVGGRNIAEEYFELDQDVLFDDYEVMAVGPVVSEISGSFDEYWNSELSVPISAFGVKVDPAKLDEKRERMARLIEEGSRGIYAQALESTLLEHLRSGKLVPTLARVELVSDSPDKLLGKVGDRDLAEVAVAVGDRFRAADKEILIVTPYFIPQESGMKLAEGILASGVRMVIVTNSLASTNHVAVHSAYARYRKRLLEAGAEIYEIRARPEELKDTGWGNNPELVTLHSKATAIDRKTIFVGSLNFDPRSILINTEMGLFIDSTALGAVFTAIMFQDLRKVAYKVDLDESGRLRWTYDYNGVQETLYKEPQTSWSRRFKAGFYGLLPIEGQL